MKQKCFRSLGCLVGMVLAGSGAWPAWADVPQAVLQAEAERIAAIEKAKPSVVAVFPPAGPGGGSGVVISRDGYALTNFHVVRPCGNWMKCGLPDGKVYDAVVVGLDPTGDVGLIKLFGRDDFPAAEMGDSDQVQMGDWVFAMGNPFMLANDFQPTVTYGIVSGIRRYQPPAGTILEYTDCIQTDASINPGNSGGPLFDAKGRLIGINGRGSFEKRGRVNVGVGYAISINQIKNFLGHLHGGRIVDHATLGATVTTDDKGRVVVNHILESSDAYRRGLNPGDEIISFGGRPISTPNHFKNVLGIFPKGWRVPLSFVHEGQRHDVYVRLAGVHRTDELLDLIEGRRGGPMPMPIPMPKPEEKPAPEKPVPIKPAPEKPTPENPAPEKPSPEKPSLEKPSPEKPSPEKPTSEKSTLEKPALEKSMPQSPSPEKPPEAKPSSEQPAGKSSSQTPDPQKPASEKSGGQEASKPSEEKPSSEKLTEKPAEAKPSPAKPDQSGEQKADVEKPAPEKPEEKPSAEKSPTPPGQKTPASAPEAKPAEQKPQPSESKEKGPSEKPAPKHIPIPIPRPGQPPIPGLIPMAPMPMPEIVKKHFESKRGYANYYFNKLHRDRVLKAWQQKFPVEGLAGDWTIRGKVENGAEYELVLTNQGLSMKVGANQLQWKAGPDLSTLLEPQHSGGLFPALYLWRRLALLGAGRFGEVNYWGTAPVIGRPGLADVLEGQYAGVESRFYFDPADGHLVLVELFGDELLDPCEVYFHEYRPVDGRWLPQRMEVRYGDIVFGVFLISQMDFQKGQWPEEPSPKEKPDEKSAKETPPKASAPPSQQPSPPSDKPTPQPKQPSSEEKLPTPSLAKPQPIIQVPPKPVSDAKPAPSEQPGQENPPGAKPEAKKPGEEKPSPEQSSQ